MAAYTDARKKMHNLRLARGFYPVVAMIPTRLQSEPGRGKDKNKGKNKTKESRQAPPHQEQEKEENKFIEEQRTSSKNSRASS